MTMLLDESSVAQRILDHIDGGTTDLGEGCWREPVANYRSQARLDAELTRIFRRMPTPFCPSAALAVPGAYVAREAAGTPLLAVRNTDNAVRVFRNACRHRGAGLACGMGQKRAFVCPYHGWVYGLDGTLRNVPHEHGFPGLDKAGHGLVQVQAEERGGMVVVTQETGGGEPLCVPDDLLGPELEMVSVTEQEVAANWKVAAEGFIEGYHIFATHKGTFYPVQFDNLNVIEHFGRNSRVAYPYRNIQKLRTVPSGDRRTDGMLTYVYHLFPNVMVATFPKRVLMIVLEPQGPAATRYVTYTLAARATLQADRLAVERDEAFVDRGVKEDQDMVQSIQRGLASEANEAFVFGRFEAAIVHFHRNLHAALAETA